ncbi:GCN5-related N-acetyltransferase [Caldicellulosiruptor kronotskyensis 2002]|uniref:GCN5-related N-acetyltransferase n=1 Tax=Caldicellulosiruptor kronotskyensis (strain DSM 18902 / VKM B-2412 / 2002) TaxID=632348 RepID=E4SFZ2_CALK2|nr:GNAT family N-acetyltransferase [Caldicellulosiruptor kronotskyensis]ADQ46667.1 GCN5-related N-acetyltransferase [Caldicellulosiruptor kronotskyensis 2002]
MIEIKEVPLENREKIKNFCSVNNVPFNADAISHVVLDGSNILGVAQIKIENGIAEILSIFVKEEYRNMGLGDGLLKMQINYCYRNSISFVKVKKGLNDNFFKRVGFVEEGVYLVLDVQAFYANLKCQQ